MAHDPDTGHSVTRSLRAERIRALHLQPPPVVEAGTRLGEVLPIMQSNRSGTVLVCAGGRLQGIFTERDVLMKLLGRAVDRDEPVERYMTPDPRVLDPDATLRDAVLMMTAGDFRHVPIVEKDGRPIGLLGARDLVDYIAEHFPAEVVNLPPRLHLTSIAPEGA